MKLLQIFSNIFSYFNAAHYGLKLTSTNITPESPKNAVHHWRSWAITINPLTSAYPLTPNNLQGEKKSA